MIVPLRAVYFAVGELMCSRLRRLESNWYFELFCNLCLHTSVRQWRIPIRQMDIAAPVGPRGARDPFDAFSLMGQPP
jgi:hypothetical protein